MFSYGRIGLTASHNSNPLIALPTHVRSFQPPKPSPVSAQLDGTTDADPETAGSVGGAAVPTAGKLTRDFSRVVLTLDNVLIPEDKLSPTPSQLDGLPEEIEMDLKILGTELIQTAGILLSLPQVAMATGQVLFQRFYYCKSFVKHPMEVVSMACMHLASKIEEAPRRIRDVISVFHHMKQVRNQKSISSLNLDQNYINLKNQVIKAERRVLKELGFCVHVKHPHKMIVLYLQVLEAERNRRLVQCAWNYMNDSFRSNVFVRFEPETIACSCIYLAARQLQIALPNNPPWFALFGVQELTIKQICLSILRLYTRRKPNAEELEKTVNEVKKLHVEAKLKAKCLLSTGTVASTPNPPSNAGTPDKYYSPATGGTGKEESGRGGNGAARRDDVKQQRGSEGKKRKSDDEDVKPESRRDYSKSDKLSAKSTKRSRSRSHDSRSHKDLKRSRSDVHRRSRDRTANDKSTKNRSSSRSGDSQPSVPSPKHHLSSSRSRQHLMQSTSVASAIPTHYRNDRDHSVSSNDRHSNAFKDRHGNRTKEDVPSSKTGSLKFSSSRHHSSDKDSRDKKSEMSSTTKQPLQYSSTSSSSNKDGGKHDSKTGYYSSSSAGKDGKYSSSKDYGGKELETMSTKYADVKQNLFNDSDKHRRVDIDLTVDSVVTSSKGHKRDSGEREEGRSRKEAKADRKRKKHQNGVVEDEEEGDGHKISRNIAVANNGRKR